MQGWVTAPGASHRMDEYGIWGCGIDTCKGTWGNGVLEDERTTAEVPKNLLTGGTIAPYIRARQVIRATAVTCERLPSAASAITTPARDWHLAYATNIFRGKLTYPGPDPGARARPREGSTLVFQRGGGPFG